MKADDLIAAANAAKAAKETNEISGNAWNIHIERTPIHTLDELIEHCKIDLTLWEVERFVANKWEVAMVPRSTTTGPVSKKTGRKTWERESTKPIIQPLFQVKAFLKKRVEVVAARAEITELRALAKIGAWKPIEREPATPTGNMLEIAIVDHHVGKLAWTAETGHENYDTKIAEKLFDQAFDEIMARASGYKLDEIWMVLGNDLLNSDDPEGRTTAGTYICSDTRFHKTFAVVRTMAIRSIEKARRKAKKVFVIMVGGNHDRRSVWHLGDSLCAWFRDCPDVVIDNQPKQYKYHQFGKVMLMFTHGDKGKRRSYPLLMATEHPEMFGSTRFREAHTGDKHHERVEEQHGVKVRILPTLCPPDAWHAENAFLGNIRSSEAFVWNKEQGLLGTIIYTA